MSADNHAVFNTVKFHISLLTVFSIVHFSHLRVFRWGKKSVREHTAVISMCSFFRCGYV